MKFFIAFAFTLMALGSLAEKTKGRKSYILPSNLKLRQRDIEQLLQNKNGYEHETDDGVDDDVNNESEPMDVVPSNVALKPDTSSGRLFFKKFFLLGKQTPSTPQFFIITQPGLSGQPIDTDPSDEFEVGFEGTVTTSPADARGENFSEDYISDDDDVYEDEITNENINNKKDRHTTYKLVKGKGNQKGLSFVVPSKYMRNFQNKQNSIVVNPSAAYNSGSNKVKKLLVSNNGGNVNVKRKRSRKPVRRFIVSQN